MSRGKHIGQYIGKGERVYEVPVRRTPYKPGIVGRFFKLWLLTVVWVVWWALTLLTAFVALGSLVGVFAGFMEGLVTGNWAELPWAVGCFIGSIGVGLLMLKGCFYADRIWYQLKSLFVWEK